MRPLGSRLTAVAFGDEVQAAASSRGLRQSRESRAASAVQQTPKSHSCKGLTSPESRRPSVHFPTRSHAAHRPSGVDSGPPWCFPGAHQRPPLPKTALNLSAVSNWQHAALGTSTLASRPLCRSSGRSQVPVATRNPHWKWLTAALFYLAAIREDGRLQHAPC